MKDDKFTITKRIKSFRYAFNGIRILIKQEHNARIHAVATIVVLLSGAILRVSKIEWIALILSIGFVITIEIINTTIEKISDFVSPHKNDTIKIVKDLSAAAVLMSAATAAAIGMIIFIPKIYILIR